MRTLIPVLLLAWTCGCIDRDSGKEVGLVANADTDWRDEVIYQILTDRFADGDINNNQNVDTNALAKWQGGDWQGVIDRIPYLKTLGVTAIWISPVVRNVEEDAGISGYHGYWTQHFLKTNPHFGDLGELNQMVNACHANGIKVLLDIVCNHVGQLFYYDINLNGKADDSLAGSGTTSPLIRITEYDPDWQPNGVQINVGGFQQGPAPVVWINDPAITRMPPEPAVFQNPDWYNRMGRVVDWNDANQVILGDFPGGLKDLDTERDDVRQALIGVFRYWIENVDFDGLRIDTVKHVQSDFWVEFCGAMRQVAARRGKYNFFMFGEAFDGNIDVLKPHTRDGALDSVFNFPEKYGVVDGVIKFGGPTSSIESSFLNRRSEYGVLPQPDGVGISPAQAVVNFIDNHDVPRFLFGGTDARKLKLALAWILTCEGVPCIYYGTEQGFSGGNDPSNRERLWDSNYDTSHEMFLWIQQLTALRSELAPLRRGAMTVRWATPRTGAEEDAGIFAFEREVGGERVLVVMNCNAGKTSATAFSGSNMPVGFAAGTILVDRLDPTYTLPVGQGGDVRIDVPALGVRIMTGP